jgi:predicted nucleic acid-binding protein
VIVLDTSVLVYAVGREHPLRTPCIDLLTAAADGLVAATTTTGVLQEFVHVRSRRRSRSDAVRLGRRYASLLSPLLPDSELVLHEGLGVFEEADRLGAFDAVLAAAAIGAGASALVSADRAFAEVPGLTQVFPDKEGIAALLRG